MRTQAEMGAVRMNAHPMTRYATSARCGLLHSYASGMLNSSNYGGSVERKYTSDHSPGEGGHSVDVSSLPIEALRGILHKLNEKSQTATRLFRSNYDIKIEDVRQLIEKIEQEYHSCTIISQHVTVSLTLAKNERYDFRSWEDFKSFDTSHAGRTSTLQVEITHDVIRNNGETPERYVVQASIQNLARSYGFMLGPITISQIGEFPIPPAPLASTVKYNNYILGKNLIGTVENWEDSLEKRENKWIQFLQNNSNIISNISIFLGAAAGIIFSTNVMSIYEVMMNNSLSLDEWIARCSLIVLVFVFIGKYSGEYFERHIDQYATPYNIILTKGDRNYDRKRVRNNTKILIKAGIGLLIVAAQLILGTWAPEIIPPLSSIF
jgi:hypothetical protein